MKDCYIGEGEISYGGSGALARAKLAGEIIEKRLEIRGISLEELRIDYIGVNSLYKDQLSEKVNGDRRDISEIRLRVAGRAKSREDVEMIVNEVESLYLNGPAGGGGIRKYIKEGVSIASIFIPKEDITVRVLYEEV